MAYKLDISDLLKKVGEHKVKVQEGLLVYGKTAGKKMEAEAKRNAPWTDRTTNARNSIKGDAEYKGAKVVISLSGNMDYSVYLEKANEGKFAILKPTVDKNSIEILKGLDKILK